VLVLQGGTDGDEHGTVFALSAFAHASEVCYAADLGCCSQLKTRACARGVKPDTYNLYHQATKYHLLTRGDDPDNIKLNKQAVVGMVRFVQAAHGTELRGGWGRSHAAG